MYPTLGVDFVLQRMEHANRRAEGAARLRQALVPREPRRAQRNSRLPRLQVCCQNSV